MQKVAAAEGFVVVRNLCGHGVGRSLHEDPRAVLNYYEPSDRRRFVLGQVLTIEPFLSFDSDRAIEGEDGWTLSTAAGGLVAQFEHTIVVTGDGPLILPRVSSYPHQFHSSAYVATSSSILGPAAAMLIGGPFGEGPLKTSSELSAE